MLNFCYNDREFLKGRGVRREMNVTEVCLVRHGETEWNRQARLQGSMDIPLSDIGIAQAKKAAKRLALEKWDVIFSSNLIRARHTAEHINELVQVDILEDAGLRERMYGTLEGMTRAEIEALYPNLFVNPQMHEVAGLESYEQLSERIRQTVENIAVHHAGKKILIVTHGGAINAFLHAVTGKRADKIGNTSISRAIFNGSDWYIDCINDCTHLEDVL